MESSAAFTDFVHAARLEPLDAALVLGSGMGAVARRIKDTRQVPFLEIPGFSATSVVGHSGCLTLGTWAGKRVLIFEGRLHFYEGHPWRSVALPVETAAYLGARVLLLTNAAGGIHESLQPGSLMTLTDHIEWTRPYCWRAPGPGALGKSRSSPYSPRLREALAQAARKLGLFLHHGTYAAVTGPCYETPAEIRALQKWGADAVGMSTAREIQAGFDKGLECAAISCITNRAAGLSDGPINHEEVLTTAAARSDPLADVLEEFLRTLPAKETGRDL